MAREQRAIRFNALLDTTVKLGFTLYIREAENLSQGFGVVFPALPTELLRKPSHARGVSASVSVFGFGRFTAKPKTSMFGWADRDSNPGPTD
jgi:hypothetical protein